MTLNLYFQKRQPLFTHKLKGKSSRYRLPLCPVQLRAVSHVNIVAKSNKFHFPMILVCDWKRLNVARYSAEDYLIG